MIYGVIYKTTGEIVRSVYCNIAMLTLQAGESELTLETVVEVADDIHYVSDGKCILKPTQETTLDKMSISANGVDVIVINNAPLGKFTVSRVLTPADFIPENIGKVIDTETGFIAGSDTFLTTIPGTYKIKIESFPYLDFEATIEAI